MYLSCYIKINLSHSTLIHENVFLAYYNFLYFTCLKVCEVFLNGVKTFSTSTECCNIQCIKSIEKLLGGVLFINAICRLCVTLTGQY